jgi:hypothetical protein
MQAMEEGPELFPGQRIPGRLRMNSGQMEAFVGINIPDSGNTALIQKERFNCRPPGMEKGNEIIFGHLQGFWSQLRKKGPGHKFIPGHKPEIAKLALIREYQRAGIIKINDAPVVLVDLSLFRGE